LTSIGQLKKNFFFDEYKSGYIELSFVEFVSVASLPHCFANLVPFAHLLITFPMSLLARLLCMLMYVHTYLHTYIHTCTRAQTRKHICMQIEWQRRLEE